MRRLALILAIIYSVSLCGSIDQNQDQKQTVKLIVNDKVIDSKLVDVHELYGLYEHIKGDAMVYKDSLYTKAHIVCVKQSEFLFRKSVMGWIIFAILFIVVLILRQKEKEKLFIVFVLLTSIILIYSLITISDLYYVDNPDYLILKEINVFNQK